MIEKIIHQNELIAIWVKRLKYGATPLTDPSQPLQVLTHKRKAGKYTKAHTHKAKKRVTKKLQECLVVINGKIKIDLYTSQSKFIKSLYVTSGQAVIFMSGGHSVRLISDSELIEVKNGPFCEDKVLIE